MESGVASVVIQSMYFDFWLTFQEVYEFKMFSLVYESEDSLTIFFKLERSCSYFRQSL